MIKNRINKLKKTFNKLEIDGYVIPKNDEFFSEYSKVNKLKIISNFSGSAGLAIISKKKNYLFVDGRYTIQAHKESGKYFEIVKYEKIINCDLFQNLTLGINSKYFTSDQIKRFFNKNKIKIINSNLIENIFKNNPHKQKRFYSLSKNIVGEAHTRKIKKISDWLKKTKSNYLFISAPENVAWLLNIRGHDNPNSPIPNCHLIMQRNKNFYLISKIDAAKKLIQEKKVKKNQIIDPKKFEILVNNLNKGKIIIDKKSCSIFYENLLKKKLQTIKKDDPIYHLKSIKNSKEIKGMINCHVLDGVALTKFLYWIKKINKKKINEFEAQKKLEYFRKLNKNYLFPSFNTIAGTGENGAIVHYRADKKTAKIINKKDIFLCDSGGQYKYGTTDVTRTICFLKPKRTIKNIFTYVLKSHIAVFSANLKKYHNGKLIDKLARKNLKKKGLDYKHGTGHGVGFFLNVHEGPQSISKFNKVKLKPGMILSNEPGYYKKGKFGIRIENLIFIKKNKSGMEFDNLTYAPIDKSLIVKELLSKKEILWLNRYHKKVYQTLKKYMDKKELDFLKKSCSNI